MSNFINRAMLEFQAAGWLDEKEQFKDEMQKVICNQVLDLLEVFHSQGHSGTTAPYAVNLFKQLARYEPIVPLTGEDWEWNEVGLVHGGPVEVFQNKRCSHVFKQKDRFNGQAYDTNGKVFFDVYEDEDGNEQKSYYTSSDSFVPITFPYTPVTEYFEGKK